MCGIVGATAVRQVSRILTEGLKRLEYRGYESAGIAVQEASSGTFNRVRVKGKVNDLRDWVATRPVPGTAGLAHTRWATHGAPVEKNAHPHIAADRVCIVHNGIIENFEPLRTRLMDLGRTFESDTDTEVVAHLIDEHLSDCDSLLDAVLRSLDELEGSFALGVMSRDEPGRIIAVRRGCPLVVGIGIGENFIASDVLALRSVTDRFVYLNESEVAVIDAESFQLLDEDGSEIDRDPVVVTDVADEISKGKYRHHMEKEIYEQPQVIRNALEGKITSGGVVEQAVMQYGNDVLDAVKAVALVGCGTSFYAASVARYWLEDMAQIPCLAEIASEFRYRNPAIPDGSLFLTVSQSGESADTIAALRVARERDYIHTMTIANVATSTLVRESDSAILMRAGPEISVASTKAFTAMLVNLLLVCLLLARRRGLSPEREAEIVSALWQLDGVVEATLELDTRLRQMALEFIQRRHALFLGRGLQYPIAMEGALKLKELSYMHAEGYPAGELKHGPLALVDAEMPVIAVAPSDELLKKVQSNLQEVRARGGQLYVFADEDAGFKPEDGLSVVEVPKVNPLLAPIVYAIPLQLLAYHVAVLRGTDVDQPRNLAKSVTVE